MRWFSFRCENTGDIFDVGWGDAERVPDIGEVVMIEGHGLAKRIPSSPSIDTRAQSQNFVRGVVSRSLPRNMEGFEHNERGQVIIRSEADARRAESMAGMQRE